MHELVELMPFATVRDLENWIARLNGLGPYMDQTIDLMREGMRRGLVQPRIVMERVPAQIARQVVEDPSGGQSLFQCIRDDAGVDTGRGTAAAAH